MPDNVVTKPENITVNKEEISTLLSSIRSTRNETRRPVSEGAEKWLGVPHWCLDYGFVYLVDYMGNDESIEQAARVSYGAGTRKVSQTRGLIRYLRRHHHTTPYEMVEIKLHVAMPIFVARQWIRHRTANVNEMSGRYSLIPLIFYTPENEHLAFQSKSNKQGREGKVPPELYTEIVKSWESLRKESGNVYSWLAQEDVARELARIDLPLSVYTQWYWKIDLHNLMHFLRLRMHSHAQYEVRVYANAIAEMVKDAFPYAYGAFEDYVLFAEQLSRWEQEFIRQNASFFPMTEGEFFARKIDELSSREMKELLTKLKEMKLVK